MRNIKVYFNDYGFRSIQGETVAGFYVHREVQALPNGKVRDRNAGWTVTDPNSGKRVGSELKSRDAARECARQIRKVFDSCGIARSERERDILTKVQGRVEDVKNIVKRFR